MQDDKSDSEKQQNVCKHECKDNPTTKNRDKKINIPLLIFALFIVIILCISVIPLIFVNGTMQTYNDTTKAEMHVNITGIFLSFFATVTYVIITYILAVQSKEAITLSTKAIDQSKKEQKIRDIENRLKNFYIPAEEIINNPIHRKSRSDIIYGYQGGLKEPSHVNGLKYIGKYSYLADKTTYNAYEKYLANACEGRKSITCRDMYRDFKDYNCPDKNGDCYEKIWGKCENNLDRCEHFNECPEKDQNHIIINNVYCKNYIEFRDAITKDIENYKEELFRLKK